MNHSETGPDEELIDTDGTLAIFVLEPSFMRNVKRQSSDPVLTFIGPCIVRLFL